MSVLGPRLPGSSAVLPAGQPRSAAAGVAAEPDLIGDGRTATDRHRARRESTDVYRRVPSSSALTRIIRAFREYLAGGPLPATVGARFLYGLAQPFRGVGVLWRDPSLRGQALAPVVVVAAVCLVTALFADELERVTGVAWMWGFVVTFFAAFIAVAPVPTVLFARRYARMAARARCESGLGPSEPYLKPLHQSLSESLRQTLIIAVGLAPVTFVLGVLPPIGTIWAVLVQAGWTLHWMTVEALDNGRTLKPGDTVFAVAAAEAREPHRPWFARWLRMDAPHWVHRLLFPIRWVLGLVDRFSRDWSPELRMIERDPALTGGFGLGIALVLAVPGLNLVFRPAAAIAAANLRARIEAQRRLD